MKSLLLTSILLSASATAGTIVSKKNVVLPVDISTTKLKLSRADYSSPVVKVLIPALADVTLLNHRNLGEGAPCMSTYDTLDPEDVIQQNPAIENVSFTIKLSRFAWVDPNTKVCKVSVSEMIEAKIRGFQFRHEQVAELPDRHMDDCR